MSTLTVRPATRLVPRSRPAAVASDVTRRPADPSSGAERDRSSVLHQLVGADGARFPYVPRRRPGR